MVIIIHYFSLFDNGLLLWPASKSFSIGLITAFWSSISIFSWKITSDDSLPFLNRITHLHSRFHFADGCWEGGQFSAVCLCLRGKHDWTKSWRKERTIWDDYRLVTFLRYFVTHFLPFWNHFNYLMPTNHRFTVS